MHDANAERLEYETDSDGEPLALSHFVHTLGTYRWPIFVIWIAVLLACTILAVAAYILSPARAITSMPFRLDFDGAAHGQYPNGLKFSTAEVTATPILLRVYQDNKLSEFVDFQTFSRSVFVLESNREMEQLYTEYQAKLADPRLNPVDRERLEKEFDLKRNSLSKSDYSINFMQAEQSRLVPTVIVHKLLNDTVATWARQAAVEKRVLDYRIPVLSANLVDRSLLTSDDYALSLVILRQKVIQLIANVLDLLNIPGAELVTTSQRHASLAEIELDLEDLLRFRLEPLLKIVHSSGLGRDPAGSVAMLEAQLAYDQRQLTAAHLKVQALQTALSAYEQDRAIATASPAAASGSTSKSGDGRGETVVSQMNDTFLDRLVALTNSATDVGYRQKLVDEIKNASFAVIPAEAAVGFDQELVTEFKSGAIRTVPNAAATAQVRAGLAETFATVDRAIAEMHEIYVNASKQLNPVTELFSVSGPPTTRRERSISVTRLALLVMLGTLLSLPLIIIGVVIHHRVREEEQLGISAPVR